MSKLYAFIRDEAGATAIEYGLIAAGISVAIIAAVNGLGTSLNTTFTNIFTQLKISSQVLMVRSFGGRLSWRPLSFQTKRAM